MPVGVVAYTDWHAGALAPAGPVEPHGGNRPLSGGVSGVGRVIGGGR
jgi:hypothetical protein